MYNDDTFLSFAQYLLNLASRPKFFKYFNGLSLGVQVGSSLQQTTYTTHPRTDLMFLSEYLTLTGGRVMTSCL